MDAQAGAAVWRSCINSHRFISFSQHATLRRARDLTRLTGGFLACVAYVLKLELTPYTSHIFQPHTAPLSRMPVTVLMPHMALTPYTPRLHASLTRLSYTPHMTLTPYTPHIFHASLSHARYRAGAETNIHTHLYISVHT